MTLKIEHINPALLVPADYNPRQITDHQLEALKRSLNRWGFVQPVIINERTGKIVGGHQRVTAALELAFETVPVVRMTLDEAAEKALNIALNKISGQWDKDKLADLLTELDADGWDLPDLGFDDLELDDLIDAEDEGDNEFEGDPDAIPEPPAKPITQPGDLWLLAPFYECEACGKTFTYEQGQAMGEECAGDCGNA